MMLSKSESRLQRSTWPAILLTFGLLAAALLARAVLNWNSAPLFADTDDAMRFTVVRDLLAGQDWFDPVQHRLNTPFGAEMHWSRLVDLPIAALILLLRPLAGTAAELAAAQIWPLILLLGLLSLSAKITVKLAGRDGLLPALVLTALCLVTLVEFAPGRIDHHSVGILLTLTMLYCTMEALNRPRLAAGAGLAAAAALAVAIENLPPTAAAIMAFGLMWALAPAHAVALRIFGLSFAGGALALAALTLSPDRWLLPACDAISVVYVTAAAGVGIAFVALSMLPVRQTWARLGLGVVAAGALAGGLVLVFPQCLGGPYSQLDPWLAEHWMSRVGEAAPIWESLGGTPSYILGTAVPVLLALAATAWRLLRGSAGDRGQWLIYALFLAVAAVVMLVQVRGARIAAELAVPAGAWLILAARNRYLARRGPLEIAGLVASWIGFAGIVIAAAATVMNPAAPPPPGSSGAEAAGKKQACLMQDAFAGLASLPPARVMTPVDLGAHVLAFTPHQVVAAPYHRNQQGIRDAMEFFNQPMEEARAILDARGIGLVAVCPQLPEMAGLAEAADDSFVKLYARGALPGWLIERSDDDSPLRIYAVAPR